MKFKIRHADFGSINNYIYDIRFSRRDFRRFKQHVIESEQTVQSAQFEERHIWEMWAERRNHVIHRLIRRYFDHVPTQILLKVQDSYWKDHRQISINSFVHCSENHDLFCMDNSCTIWNWLLREPSEAL